jgi:hypothetical protein
MRAGHRGFSMIDERDPGRRAEPDQAVRQKED